MVNLDHFSAPSNDFVSISDGFKIVFRYDVNHSLLATPSQAKWNAILEDLLFNVECGEDVLANSYWVSPKQYDSSLILIPIIMRLYCRPCIYSQHCFIAINYDPNDEVSIMVCFLENQ